MEPENACQMAYALVLEGDRFFRERDMGRARQSWQEAARLLLPMIDGPAAPLPSLCYESASVSQWRLAVLAERAGDDRSAAGLYRKALEIDEKGLPPSRNTVYFARSAGRNYLSAGDYEEALGFAQRALALRRTLEPDSLGVSRELNDMGRAHLARGEYDAALEAFHEALRICLALEPDGDDAAASLNNLGQAYWKGGDPAQGLEYHLRALHIDEERDPRSAETATSLNNVGLMYKMLRDLPTAMSYYKRAFEIDHGQDPDSLATARDFQNIAKVQAAYAEIFAAAGERSAVAEARTAEYDFMQRALAIAERRAPGSPVHADVLRSIGDAVSAQGDSAQADEYYRRANEITTRNPGQRNG
jgi:tetratricopeptide (TPR) repeat protein